MGKKRKERREQVRLAKEKSVSKSNKKKKPDLWLTLFAIAVGIVMNWIPKTPPFLIGSLLLILILIGHPIWNLWWVEKKLWRRCCSLLLAIIGLTIFGYYVWPQTNQEKPLTFDGYLKDALVTDSEDGYRLIIVRGTITKLSGPSSSIIDWRMFLRFPNGMIIEGETLPISDRDTVMHFKGKVNDNFPLKKKEYLPDMGIKPLEKGNAMDGWFCAKFKDDDIGNAQNKKAVIIVTFNDALTDKVHPYSINIPNKNDTHFPKSF